MIVAAFTLPQLAIAQTSGSACQEAINAELAKELRLHRAVVFGEIGAADAPVGHVRYDTDGEPWIKVGGSDEGRRWASLKGDKNRVLSNGEAADKFHMSLEEATSAPTGTVRIDAEGIIWRKINVPRAGINEWRAALTFQSDDEMDENEEIEPRRGILDTKRTLTHELVPYLMQSVRALQCRAQAICDIALQSMIASPEGGEAAVEIVTVEPLGCLPMFRSPIAACRFPADEAGVMLSEQTGMLNYCPGVRDEMLEREAALLKFVVEYDAAYRTMLQLAGNLDLTIQELRWPFIHTIRNAASLLGTMSRIPCFLSTCDMSPIPFPEPGT